MATESGIPPNLASSAASDLMLLRSFAGPAKEFWSRYLNALAALAGASRIVLCTRETGPDAAWRRLTDVSRPGGDNRHMVLFSQQVEDMAEACCNQGRALRALDSGKVSSSYVASLPLRLAQLEQSTAVVFLMPEVNEPAARERLGRLELATDVPATFQSHQAGHQARADVLKFALALDVLASVNAQSRFYAAALAFCNALATHLGCDRVSLGWLEGTVVRLRAVSRMERFDRRLDAARSLEVAMEEALDQDEEILHPRPEDASFVARDHERFASEQKVSSVCSVPLRAGSKPVAVLTCERRDPFTPVHLQQLRLCADQAAPRLSDLHRRDRWFGARAAIATRELAANVVGPQQTWAKVLVVLGLVAIAALVFLKIEYRVEGQCILRSDALTYLTAPYDGFIEQAAVRPGDRVAPHQPLVTLRTNELVLDEAAAAADLVRFQREAEKARANNALAEMRIAAALAEQAQARLDTIRFRLGQATIVAPAATVVIEGDLRERLGAPVKQGEPLLKVAQFETLYVQAEVNERDIHEIREGASGSIAFVTQPRLKFRIRVVRIEPAATAKNRENVFVVRAEVMDPPPSWWRPGMSGIAKIPAGRRTLGWVLTHRTIDFLRLKLWWP